VKRSRICNYIAGFCWLGARSYPKGIRTHTLGGHIELSSII